MIGKKEIKVAPHNPKMRRQEASQTNGMPAPAAIRPSRSDDNAEINWLMLLFALGLLSAQFIPLASAQQIIKKSSAPKNPKSSLAKAAKQPVKQIDFIVDQAGVVNAHNQTTPINNSYASIQHNLPTAALSLKQQRRSAIIELLMGRIQISNSAKKYYKKKNTKNFQDDVNQVTEHLLQLADDNESYCKLQAIFADPRFKIYMIGYNHPDANVPASFDADENRVYCRVNVPANEYMNTIFEHEFHHANEAAQNKKMGRHDLGNGHIAPRACGTGFWDREHANCLEFKKILVNGKASANNLLKLMNTPVTKLSTEQAAKVKAFKTAAKNYKPAEAEIELPESSIQELRQNGILNNQLQILALGGTFPATYPQTGDNCVIFSINKRDDQYYGNTRLVADLNDPTAALQDIIFGFKVTKVYYGQGSTLLEEIDAYIHQLFERYDELKDLLFPGLKEFHLKRSSPEYKLCIEEQKNAARDFHQFNV